MRHQGSVVSTYMNSEFRLLLEQQIARLEARLFDLQAQMPAHSVSPTLVAQIDEIDDQLESLRLQLATHQDRPESGQE